MRTKIALHPKTPALPWLLEGGFRFQLVLGSVAAYAD